MATLFRAMIGFFLAAYILYPHAVTQWLRQNVLTRLEENCAIVNSPDARYRFRHDDCRR